MSLSEELASIPAGTGDRYPRWTLSIRRTDGPFMVGTCGCGWVSLPHVRTVTLAEAWDRHMMDSIDNPSLHKDPVPRTLREILFSHRALAGATAEQITELMAELKPLFRDSE